MLNQTKHQQQRMLTRKQKKFFLPFSIPPERNETEKKSSKVSSIVKVVAGPYCFMIAPQTPSNTKLQLLFTRLPKYAFTTRPCPGVRLIDVKKK
jgi:hypothetical protein